MTASVRYRKVTNTTGAVLTAASFSGDDGNDKSYQVVRREYAAADIGAGAGQTLDQGGCILCTIPRGVNLLSWECLTYQLFDGKYNLLDNTSQNDTEAFLSYFVNQNDRTIRVYDQGANADYQIDTNSYTIVKMVTGSA